MKGVVQKIIVNAQYGLTSFTLKGQDGFFSLGDKKPTFTEGESIQFDTQPKGKYTYAINIAPWTDGGTVSSAPVASVANGASNGWKGRGGFQRGGSGGANEKDEYWRRKEERDLAKEGDYAATQKRIEIQAARNAAIETARTMWQFDITPKPKKVGDHYDAFLALVEELTDKYLESTQGRFHIATEAGASVAAAVAGGNATGSQEGAGASQVSSSNGNWE
jgi:hypothetical protein